MGATKALSWRQRMPDLLIRGLSAEALDRLKAQAARNGRSMQAEATSIIESGIKPTMAEWLDRVERSRERIEAQRGVLPGSSADLIRELRESRDES
ncbi:MAG: hypothetical protein Q8K99_10565 [Actinomycetota bacterium]|nr:hypothetical protein [Actinomycetota bacterium]